MVKLRIYSVREPDIQYSVGDPDSPLSLYHEAGRSHLVGKLRTYALLGTIESIL